MVKLLWLALGGVLGTLSRYVVSVTVNKLAHVLHFGFFAVNGTMVVNVVGCFIAGFLIIMAERKFALIPSVEIFLVIGFCGAFTTFSTMMIELSHMVEKGNGLLAFTTLLISVTVGFLFFRLGVTFAKVF